MLPSTLGVQLLLQAGHGVPSHDPHDSSISQCPRLCVQNALPIYSPLGPPLCIHASCKGRWSQHFASKRVPQFMNNVEDDDPQVKLQLSHLYRKTFLHGDGESPV